MSGLKPKDPSHEAPSPHDPGCLVAQPVPALCLRLQSHRHRIALPYALLLRAELSEDDSACMIMFATHTVHVQGRHLERLYIAVSQGLAAQVGIGRAEKFSEGDLHGDPLVTQVRIEPIMESDKTRR